jgi:hypothetical protein
MLTAIDNIAVRFLKLVLPEQGYYIAAIKHHKANGFRKGEFADTIEELASINAERDRDGLECYFALASFKEPLNDPPGTPANQKRLGRTKRNAAGVKAFWLDIDVGPNKPYKTVTRQARRSAHSAGHTNSPTRSSSPAAAGCMSTGR